jgi:hypothetical protein
MKLNYEDMGVQLDEANMIKEREVNSVNRAINLYILYFIFSSVYTYIYIVLFYLVNVLIDRFKSQSNENKTKTIK